MADFTYAQKCFDESGSGGTEISATWGGNTTSGSGVIVVVQWDGDVQINSVTDSQGNTYVDCGAGRVQRPGGGFLSYMQILGAPNPTGGAGTVVVHFVSSVTEGHVFFFEYPNADLDQLFEDGGSGVAFSSGTATSGTTLTASNLTPPITNGMVFAACSSVQPTGGSPGSGFTERHDQTGGGGAMEDRIFTSSVGTINPSYDYPNAITNGIILAAVVRSSSSSGGADVPSVSSRTPADNATHVARHPPISLTFNQNVKRGASGNFVITRTGVGAVETIAITNTAQVTISGATVSFHLTAPLLPSTDYHIELDADAILADDDDEPYGGISGSTAWNFRTDDPGAQCAAGSLSTGTGAASTTFSITGLSFAPKLILLCWSGSTSSTDSITTGTNADHRRGFGFFAIQPATGTLLQGAISTQSEDDSGSADCDSYHTTADCIAVLSIAGAVVGLAAGQSMNSDGATFVVNDAMPNDLRVHWIACGGEQLEDVAAGVLTEPGATGNQDITSPGWEPAAAFFMSAMIGADPPGTAVDSSCMFGVVAGATPSNYVWAGGSNNGAATIQTVRYCRGGECIALLAAAVTSTDAHATGSFLSTGFRLNWTERAASRRVLWVAVKGGAWHAGDFLTQTDTTTDIVETGVGFEPRGLVFVSHGTSQSSSDTVQDHDRWSMGFATSTSSEQAMAVQDEDATASSASEVSFAVEHDNFYVNITDAAVDGAANLTAVGSDGWTARMTNADPAQAFGWYLAFGNKARSPPWISGPQRNLRANPIYRM